MWVNQKVTGNIRKSLVQYSFVSFSFTRETKSSIILDACDFNYIGCITI